MKKTITEVQLKAKIFQMVREQLEEQPKKYVSDYSEPAQTLFNYAEKCDILKETLNEYAQQLENIIDEVNNAIAEVLGTEFAKKFWTSGDEVEILVNLQQKDFVAIKNYLMQHQNEFSEQFSEYGDYEGMNIEEVVNDPNTMLEFIGNVLEAKADEINNGLNGFSVRMSSFGQKENLQNFTYTNTISAEISCPIDFNKLEGITEIADI